MSRNNIWGLWGGGALVGVGFIFLIGQFLQVNVMHYFWPFFIIGAGAVFFMGMVAGGRSTGALAVPGSVFVTVGLILFFQNLTGLWASWAYAWALIISGAGIGLVIFARWSGHPDLGRAGRVVAGVGLVFFFLFGLFFELGAALIGLRSSSGIFWALGLILIGLYVIFGRGFFRRASGPVSRTAMDFSSQPAGVGGAFPAVMRAPADQPVAAEFQGAAPLDLTAAEARELQYVRRVQYHALGNMTILQGERQGLEIDAPEAVKERIRVETRGDTLEIRYEQDWLDWLNPRFWNIAPIQYTLYLRDLEFLEAAGLGNLSIPALSTSRLEIDHSGTGNVTIFRLETDALSIDQGGLGTVEIEGRAGRQDVELSGTGSYHAGRLQSREASVRLSGLGSAVVWVEDVLDARVNGMGSIDYYGSPRVTQQVSGLGNVRRIGGR